MQGLQRQQRLRQPSQACASAGLHITPLHVVRRPRRSSRNATQRIVCYASAPVGVTSTIEKTQEARPLPTRTESVVDDPRLANPLERQNRLSTAWFGVITEFDGVLVDSTEAANIQAWLEVAEEMRLPRPLGQVLRRIQGARDEVVIMQLFHWTRNPSQAAKIAQRKEEIYDSIMNGVQPAEVPGSRSFLDTLRNYNIPVALATAQPERRVRPVLEKLNLSNYFDGIVTAEDNGSPEVEFYYISAANQLQRPFVRCIVVGDSNRSVEAAHELGMKSVIVTGSQPAWNFSNADLVVRNLSALSFVNMKKLFGNEDLIEPQFEQEEESSYL
eukprot:GHUV01001395.1.p1 GENE.GHUV01001395.1~~GHUV01001395.1.p1  ORF type:complete len:329 (+),score=51.58 GHUV01001395.1:231-1217(+)